MSDEQVVPTEEVTEEAVAVPEAEVVAEGSPVEESNPPAMTPESLAEQAANEVVPEV